MCNCSRSHIHQPPVAPPEAILSVEKMFGIVEKILQFFQTNLLQTEDTFVYLYHLPSDKKYQSFTESCRESLRDFSIVMKLIIDNRELCTQITPIRELD